MSARVLAAAFCRELLATIGPEKLELVRVRNAVMDDGCCASHDFCDANMVMDRAFASVFGRESWCPMHTEAGECSEAEEAADLALWNEAWDLAKAAGLDAVACEWRACP